MSAAPPPQRLEVLADPAALAQRAARWLLDAVRAGGERPAVALSGGSTPAPLYRLLTTEPFRSSFPWARVHWFWGDERLVPPDHPASNYRMVREMMLARAPVPMANIHPVPTTDLDAAVAAVRYEAELRAFHGGVLDAARPLFAATLLGLGEDGHTASLFPGGAALDETVRWALPVVGVKPEPRVTLTYPALNSSTAVAFLVSGAAKRAMLARALAGDHALPAARVTPSGRLCWLVDRAAAPAAAIR